MSVLDEAAWMNLIDTIPLSKIWGVGGKLDLKYKQHDLRFVADLLAIDTAQLASIFGVGGVQLQSELRGNSVLKVAARAVPQQSIISSRSFAKPVFAKQVLADAVAFHVRQVGADLRAQGLETKSLRVSIQPNRYGDFFLRGGSKEVILPVATANTIYLQQEAYKLLDELYEVGVPYKKAGVSLVGLKAVGSEQQQLFQTGEQVKSDSLMQVIDELNKHGKGELVMVGSRLKTKDWRTRTDAPSPAYTTRWLDVARVQAK